MDGFNADRAEWVIVTAYAITFGLTLWARHRTPDADMRLFWALAAVVILALGINKQLDLQTTITQFGRQLARDGGWFDQRRQVQAMFIAALAVSMGVVTILALWLVRRLGPPVWLALAGLLLLGGFVLLRAASFHHIDVLLRTTLLGTRAWVVIELAGIVIVAIAALWQVARRPRSAPPVPI